MTVACAKGLYLRLGDRLPCLSVSNRTWVASFWAKLAFQLLILVWTVIRFSRVLVLRILMVLASFCTHGFGALLIIKYIIFDCGEPWLTLFRLLINVESIT